MSRSRKSSEAFVKRIQLELGQVKEVNFLLTQNGSQIQAALNPYLLAYQPDGELPYNAVDPSYRSKAEYQQVLALGSFNWLNHLPFFLADKEDVFFITPPLSNPIVIEFLHGWDLRFIFRDTSRLPSFDFYIGDKHGTFLFYCDEDRYLYGWG